MTIPKRFWRFSYDSEALVDGMLRSGTINAPKLGLRSPKYDPEKVLRAEIKVGDGVFLAKFDEGNMTGQINAIGIVRALMPTLVVSWQKHTRTVYPHPGGYEPWRCRCFKFDKAVAERYNLAEDFKSKFKNEIDNAS